MLKQFFLGLTFIAASHATMAGNYQQQYEVTITNVTPGQSFTPQLVVTHPRKVSLFTLGEPASSELEILAEGGNTGPLTDAIANDIFAATTIDGLLTPGQSTTISINGPRRGGYISIAAMMIPTNDSFMALNRVRLPRSGTSTKWLHAYDAGTEANDQSCQHIPGPRCGGEGYSEVANEADEGFVHIGNGFHQLADQDEQGFEILSPNIYDWRNFVAKVTIKRVK